MLFFKLCFDAWLVQCKPQKFQIEILQDVFNLQKIEAMLLNVKDQIPALTQGVKIGDLEKFCKDLITRVDAADDV